MALCFASHCSNFSLSLSFAHYPVRECIKYQTRRRNTAPSSLDVVLGRQGKRSHSCKKKKKKKQDPSIHGATKCPPYCSATTTKGDWSWALVDSLSSRYRSTDQSVDSITGRIRFNFTGSFLPPLLLPFHIRGFSIGLVWPRSMSGSPVIASATLTRPNPTQLTDSLSRPIFSSYIVENALGFLVICTQQC